MSVFRLCFNYSYHSDMVASFINSRNVDASIFIDSKKILDLFELEFKCNTLSKCFNNQHFICCDLEGFIISSIAKNKFEIFLSGDIVQYIPVKLFCKDTILGDYHFLHILKKNYIIDIENSNKIYFNNEDFILQEPIKTFPNSLNKDHIGRHKITPYDTEIFFSDDFVSFIKNCNLNKNITFY